MKSTQRRITNAYINTTTPNVVEPDPEPIELFKDTPYSNTKTKRPTAEHVHQKAIAQNVKKSKRLKLNPIEPTYDKTPKKFLEEFAKTLPKELSEELENNNGKPHKKKSFTADVVIRHILPCVLNYNIKPQDEVKKDFFEHLRWNQLLPDSLAAPKLSSNDLINLQAVTGKVGKYFKLYHKYANIDTSRAKGYATFREFKSEKTFNKERINLYSAVLFQKGFSVEKTIRYVGGPHTASHRNPRKIRERLEGKIEPEVLKRLIHIFTYGAPSVVDGHNTEDNFQKFKKYGNHSSDRRVERAL